MFGLGLSALTSALAHQQVLLYDLKELRIELGDCIFVEVGSQGLSSHVIEGDDAVGILEGSAPAYVVTNLFLHGLSKPFLHLVHVYLRVANLYGFSDRKQPS